MSDEVETAHGRLRGAESAGIRSFLGIPYAAPLSVARRFLPPEQPEPWTRTRDARHSGAAAPQMALPVFRWINSGDSQHENCLSLNLWTPGLDAAKRPVLVWIHGGGFLIGSGSTSLYRGHDLARRGDAVVVTLNYRLGALGFAHLGSIFGRGFEQSTNLGVRDQIAALEWVRANIENFGGDLDNVTVFGQSAGAMSIGALLGAPRARALFHRAICMSGAADHVLDREDAQRVARAFVRELGGPAPSHRVLARIPLAQLLEAQRRTMARLVDLRSMMVFLPMVDGDLIPEPPLDAVRRGATAHIPLLTGTTLEEWKLFRAIDQGVGRFGWSDLVRRLEAVLGDFVDAPDAQTAALCYREALAGRSAAHRPFDAWSAFQSARVFHLPSARLAEAQHHGGGSIHSYLFTWRPPALGRFVGACHALDIPFVFGSTAHPLARPLLGFSPQAPRLGRKMQHAWLRFARDGAPCHARLPDWPPYEPVGRAMMIFGRHCELARAPLEAERALLERWSGSGPSVGRLRVAGATG